MREPEAHKVTPECVGTFFLILLARSTDLELGTRTAYTSAVSRSLYALFRPDTFPRLRSEHVLTQEVLLGVRSYRSYPIGQGAERSKVLICPGESVDHGN